MNEEEIAQDLENLAQRFRDGEYEAYEIKTRQPSHKKDRPGKVVIKFETIERWRMMTRSIDESE